METLIKLIQQGVDAHFTKNYAILTPDRVETDPGREYVRVVRCSMHTRSKKLPDGTWVEGEPEVNQRFAHLFVHLPTGLIFGAASWKKPNFNQCYGTLDTLDQYVWGGFYPVPKDGRKTLTPKDCRKPDQFHRLVTAFNAVAA